jgi:integrase
VPKLLHHALTPLQVKNAKPGRYADGGGLQLLVKSTGARSWVFRFMLKGRTRDIGLGPAGGPGAITLSKARDDADDLCKLVKTGVDPLQFREEEAAKAAAAAQAAAIAGITFRESAEAYIAAHEARWRNAKHRSQWTNTLEAYVFPLIGDIPVREIGTEHVMSVLEPIWRAKPETASRVRGRIESVLDAARARGHRTGENPARWRGHIAEMLPARQRLSRGHHKALAYADVPAFIQALREREAVAALALEFTILTVARSGETIGATWEEVDLDKALWIVPASRMKAGREHRVPLSPRAVQILKSTQQLKGTHLFPGTKSPRLSVMAMTMLLRRMKVDATVHGFRSSFRDWAAEQTGFPHEVAEMALAHTIENKAEAAYRRGDLFAKRRKLMEAWAAFCERPAISSATVTPIRKEAG